MILGWDEGKKRTSIGKKEWDTVKKLHGNKCKICDKMEKQAGILHKAHIKAHSKGGTQYFPLCPTCHYRYDNNKLTATELKKIDLTKAEYSKLKPKKSKRKSDSFF